MPLEVTFSSSTYSHNVLLHDYYLKSYAGVEILSGGVQFDVFLMCENLGSSSIDLTEDGFYGVIQVLRYFPMDFDPILGLEAIRASEVIFSHVTDPSNFDSTSEVGWDNLAKDSVEWLLRGRVGRASPVVSRRSRYGRDPVI